MLADKGAVAKRQDKGGAVRAGEGVRKAGQDF